MIISPRQAFRHEITQFTNQAHKHLRRWPQHKTTIWKLKEDFNKLIEKLNEIEAESEARIAADTVFRRVQRCSA